MSLLVSLVLHAVAAAALIIDWSRPPVESNAAPPAAMTVELASMPASAPLPPSDIPPGPQQVEATPQPQPPEKAKFDPPPEADDALKPNFAVPVAQQVKPMETVVAAKDTSATTAPPSADAPPLEKSQAPLEGSNAAPPSDAEQGWEGRLVAKLARNKRYPAAAQVAGLQDTVFVRLVLDRKGQLIEATLKKSGGFALLDSETLALARRASPYPSPPDSVAGERIVRIVPVEFYIGKRR